MKSRTIVLLFIIFFCLGNSFGQNSNLIENDKSQNIALQNSPERLNDIIKQPKTKKQAVAGVKVMNRHGAKFYHNNVEIPFTKAKKLVRKDFEHLNIMVNPKTNDIRIKDKK